MAEAEDGDLIAAIKTDPILAPYVDALLRLARPSSRLTVDPEAPRSIGESRVGGPPAAHVGFSWPTRHVDMPRPSKAWLDSHPYEERRLPEDGVSSFQFIAQIDLSAIASFDVDEVLPHDGVLLFFYDEAYSADIDPAGPLEPTSWSLRDGEPEFYQREFGSDPVDQVRVLHVPGDLSLAPHRSGPFAADALPLVGSAELTVPSVDAYVIAQDSEPPDRLGGRLVLPPDAWDRLAELRYQHRANARINQMLGWEDNSAHGPSLPPGTTGWDSIPADDRLRELSDPRLLLQLDPATYERLGIEFGRTLYFYARETDLRRGDFSRAWYDSD